MAYKIRISRLCMWMAVLLIHYTIAAGDYLRQDLRNLEENPTVDAEHGGGEKVSPDDPAFLFYVFASIGLILFAGAMSGLTVGYLSIDELQLELKMRNGTDEEKRQAAIISPILAKHHLLLSTLLVANAFAMEALPICLDRILPSYWAVIISTAGVVTFGEIIPQAVCTGPQQIQIAATVAPGVKILILALWIVCYPVSKALDYFLGTHHKTRFNKTDLKTLMELHVMDKQGQVHSLSHPQEQEMGKFTELTAEETKVINSTIDLRDTPVTKEMETFQKIYMLSDNDKIDKEMIKRIARSGFSKIPIYSGYDKNTIIGILKVKLLIDYQDQFLDKTVKESKVQLAKPVIVSQDTSMLEMLMLFQEEKTSIALISEKKVKKDPLNPNRRKDLLVRPDEDFKIKGLISLKDIFEEILESKMNDEDVHGPVTMFSGPGKKIRKLRADDEFNEPVEADANPEKGLTQALLNKKK